MKILHINAGLENGGGLTHIINLLSEAKRENKNFELLTFAEGPVAQAARKRGINVHVLNSSSRYNLSLTKNLKRIINEGNYDIVHTHGARANLYLSLIHKSIKAKWAVTVHSDPAIDFEGRGFLGKIFTNLNIRAIRRADCVFAITNRFSKMLASKYNVAADKIHVIYNGIDFHSNSEIPAKVRHQHFNIVNVARCEKVKGQDLLIKAVKKLNNRHVRLHIAGDGSQLESLKKMALDLGINQQVVFHGFVSQERLTRLYRKMDLAALTSYSESFPLVLLEASDNLVPLLATDVGDMKQLIPDEKHGLIANIGDVDSIVEQIKKYLSKTSDERLKLAEREKEYASSRFSLNNQLVSIIDTYENLLN